MSYHRLGIAMNLLWSALCRARALRGDREAVVDGSCRRSYVETAERAAAVAAFLHAQGVGPGDRVAIAEHNSAAFLECTFAAAAVGAILVPLNWRLAPGELRAILDDADTRLVLANARLAGVVDAALAPATGPRPCPVQQVLWIGGLPARPAAGPDAQVYEEIASGSHQRLPIAAVPPDSVAQLYYTSGTTGRSKGVVLTQHNVYLHALGAVAELGLTDADTWGHIAPMFHLADAWATVAVTLVGGRHAMIPTFDAERALETIASERITITNLIPTMLNLMLNLMARHGSAERHDRSSLRAILSGGAPIAPGLVRRIVDLFGCEYIQTYGMTETSPYLTLSTLKAHLQSLPVDRRLAMQARTGRPFVTVELRLVDDRGQPVAVDDRQVGEIQVRGPTVTPGYWNLPDETRAAFTDDGWLRTGDLATVDAEGYVNIVDRKKDMIICGGENVYSIEVENVLYEHPQVLEAAVFGTPDEIWGESVVAAVVPRPGQRPSAAALVAFCKERIAPFKAPRVVCFHDQLPKTGSGKIAKRLLRELYRQRAAAED